MKILILITVSMISINASAYTVIDSLYESYNPFNRVPSSTDIKYCIVTEDQKIFNNNCYSTIDLCNKRLDFWKDLPDVKNQICAKIQ